MTTGAIRGKMVSLRAPEPRDVPQLNAWANDPGLWRNLTGWHFPYSMASTERWVETPRAPTSAHQVWCIEAPGAGFIGTGSLSGLDWKNRNATIGLLVGSEANRGTGLAVDASFALMRYAFDELGLNRLEAPVLAYNERSLRMFTQKLGFRQEGIRQQAHFREGRFHDEVLLGLLAEDYRANLAGYWEASATATVISSENASSRPSTQAAGGRVTIAELAM
jgi:RimJ/RimL family protein N-acetyltransferase